MTWLALTRKAWLETRTRFFTGLVVVVVVCAFMVLVRPRMLVQWPLDKIQHPEWRDPPWWDRVHTDFPFFLWHYLYRDMLQKVFMVFAVLLGIGGIRREAASGTAGFTLALPVSRALVFGTRALVAVAEVVALGLAVAITLVALAPVTGITYTPSHAALHAALLVVGALVLLAGSLWISTTVDGEHTPALIGLAAVGTFNFALAPYIDGGQVRGWLRAFDLMQVMSGGTGGSVADVWWSGVLASLGVGATALAWAFHRSRVDDV